MAIAIYAFLLQLLLFFFVSFAETNNPRKIYLVQMKAGGHRYGSSSGHQELLSEVLDTNSTVENALIYSYKESFTGFSARLTQNERQKLKRRSEVLDVSRSRNLKPHTTRSWDFMNLTLSAERRPQDESNLVVAIIDSGIWPYSELFSSDTPPPKEWQGKCENITCNSKIIGARSYYPKKKDFEYIDEEKSVIDVYGHGTHVASIAAGREVEGSYFGLAKGTMRGGVPNAKIAVYKTCWRVKRKKSVKTSFVCPQYIGLKAIEDAIVDKVNVISYSQGHNIPRPLHKDHISWAFLRALEKDILTSTVAGNNGSDSNYYAVTQGAPWVMTVAASSKDRFLETKLEVEGEKEPITVYNTINTFETQDHFYPFFNPPASSGSARKRELIAQSKNDPTSTDANYEGKDVLFDYYKKKPPCLDQLIEEGAKGAVVLNVPTDYNESNKFQLPIASIFLNDIKRAELSKIMKNIDTGKRFVKIHKTVEIPREEGWIPTVANFSSWGPHCDKYLANILKPDIAAPGVDIVAGWPVNVPLLSDVPATYYRHLRFNMLSGTSMACPHATGLALYLKSFQPSWSPSAIKSALMTTSSEMIGPGEEFAYGSGLLNATKVRDPGLIYETTHQDYIDYLCKQGYDTEKLRSHLGKHEIDCSGIKKDENADLNYPSMTAQVELNAPFSKVFKRTVTNVGAPSSTYLGEIKYRGEKDFEAEITVEPKRLEFSKLEETKTFTVHVTGEAKPNSGSEKSFKISNTWLIWTEIDGSRQVRTPIVIYSIARESQACT